VKRADGWNFQLITEATVKGLSLYKRYEFKEISRAM
jgi:hypothetical protein